MEKYVKYAYPVAVASGLAIGASAFAVDDASVTAVNGIAETFIGDISSIVTANLPVILLVAVIIVGTMIVYRLAKRFIK